jgi:hypothetical protein
MIDFREEREQTCEWCGGTIPQGGMSCQSCGAVRPRDDVVVPGLNERKDQQSSDLDEISAMQINEDWPTENILPDLNTESSDTHSPALARRSDPGGDAIVIIALLVIAAVIGGLMGWFLAPPLLHDLFEGTIGVESDGPEAFRRLGAFIGALFSMLFGAMLATMVRR